MAKAKRIEGKNLPKIKPLISHAVAVGDLVITGVEAGKRDDGTLGETVEEQMELALPVNHFQMDSGAPVSPAAALALS